MQSINLNEIEKIGKRLNKILDEFPGMRRKFHEEVAKETLTMIKNGFGNRKVASWQERHVGTKGGYAAVRPMAKTYYAKYAVGYITNAITSGHRVRPCSQKYSRAKLNYVSGKHIYIDTVDKATNMAEKKAETMTKELEEKLKGL